MSAPPEYVSRSKGRDGYPVCPRCDDGLKPLWPERSELEYGYHDSWWCDRCQVDFETDPDEDLGEVEDEKWPLWHEPEIYEGHMGRKIGIWVFGLLASSIIGSLIGQKLDYTAGGFWGFFGGIFTFACIRLWLSPSQNTEK